VAAFSFALSPTGTAPPISSRDRRITGLNHFERRMNACLRVSSAPGR